MVLVLSKTCPLVKAQSKLLSRRKVPFLKVIPLPESRLDHLVSVAARLLKVEYRPADEVGRVTVIVVVDALSEVKHFTFGIFILAAVQSYTRAVWEPRSAKDAMYLHRFPTFNLDLTIKRSLVDQLMRFYADRSSHLWIVVPLIRGQQLVKTAMFSHFNCFYQQHWVTVESTVVSHPRY